MSWILRSFSTKFTFAKYCKYRATYRIKCPNIVLYCADQKNTWLNTTLYNTSISWLSHVLSHLILSTRKWRMQSALTSGVGRSSSSLQFVLVQPEWWSGRAHSFSSRWKRGRLNEYYRMYNFLIGKLWIELFVINHRWKSGEPLSPNEETLDWALSGVYVSKVSFVYLN